RAPHLRIHHLSEPGELNAPWDELEDAERRRVGAVFPWRDDGGVVAERRRRALVEVPDAAFRLEVVVPLRLAVGIDLLVVLVPVRQRNVRIALEMLRFQRDRARADPPGRSFPEWVKD